MIPACYGAAPTSTHPIPPRFLCLIPRVLFRDSFYWHSSFSLGLGSEGAAKTRIDHRERKRETIARQAPARIQVRSLLTIRAPVSVMIVCSRVLHGVPIYVTAHASIFAVIQSTAARAVADVPKGRSAVKGIVKRPVPGLCPICVGSAASTDRRTSSTAESAQPHEIGRAHV